jgi:methylglutaconyl-CoA hydratase
LSDYKNILIRTLSPGHKQVVMNRPDVHNAFNAEMISEITQVFQNFNKEKDLRLVSLAAEGKSFSAGADLNWMKSMVDFTEDENKKDARALAAMFEAIQEVDCPLIGLVHGHAFGGGVGLLAVCDYVICSENCKFAFSEVKLGIIPAVISPFVVEKIGMSWARAYFLSGSVFTPATAMKMQLVHKVVVQENMQENFQKLADDFLLAGPNASKHAKVLLRTLIDKKVDTREYTCEQIAKLRVKPEAQEGMHALLEKRRPKWQTQEEL